MIPLPKNIQAKNFILTVEFENGQVRQIDVRTFVGEGAKANEIKKSLSEFETAYIEDEISITWKNGFSIDPDVIYTDGSVVNALPATGSFLKKIQEKSKFK